MDYKNLYHYGLYVSSLVGELNNVPKKIITKKYNDLPIHNINEIDITGKRIAEILQREPGNYLKGILKIIENDILLGKIKNNEEELKNYILEHKEMFLAL